MKKALPILVVPLLFLAALAARAKSPGVALTSCVTLYLNAIAEGRGALAWESLSDSLGLQVSPEFLQRLAGSPVPGSVFIDGVDRRGIRITAVTSGASRTLWLQQTGSEYRVSGDEMLDGLLGEAVFLCRAAALSGSTSCPVSGRDYVLLQNSVVCPSGHLGEGLNFSPEACSALREEAAEAVRTFMSLGHPAPPDLESIHTISGGDVGRRGGWRCPDNAYSYYLLLSDSVVCSHHGASTPVNP